MERQQQQAFETLKQLLILAPILRYPDFAQSFYLHTDAVKVLEKVLFIFKDSKLKSKES